MPRQVAASFVSRKRWTEVEAREALAAHAESGLALSEFAAREGLDAQRLRRWAQRLDGDRAVAQHDRPRTPVFVEIHGRPATVVEVELRSGRVVRVSDAIDPMVLRGLLDAIDEAAC